MILAATDSFGYRLFFLLHILAILVAFAPAFVWPVVNARLRTQGATPGAEIGKIIRDSWARIHGPALVLAGLFGILMVVIERQGHLGVLPDLGLDGLPAVVPDAGGGVRPDAVERAEERRGRRGRRSALRRVQRRSSTCSCC